MTEIDSKGLDPKALAQRAVDGDADAFNELIKLYHPALFRLANRMLRNVDDAQEVAQEAFLAAYEGMAKFQGQSHVRTWLLSITYNKAVDRLKRTTRDNWLIAGDLEKSDRWEIVERVSETTDWGGNPEQNFQASEIRLTLDKVLATVPAETRAVFELRDIQGLTSKEVAEALGIPEGTVRVRLHRVRQYLMAAMQDFISTEGR